MNGMYGFLSNSYCEVNPCEYVIIPENMDYKENSIQTVIDKELNHCTIDLYGYDSAIVPECNSERVSYMKEFLINEKIKNIIKLNDDYVICLEYILYDSNGQIMRSDTTSIKAKYYNAILNSNIKKDNTLEYRRGFVFDGQLEIPIPSISRYGINFYAVMHPYTIKIKKISVITTTGDTRFIKDHNSQVNTNFKNHINHCHHSFHHPTITNAELGTTIIDQVVVPKELDTANDYEIVKVAEIECTDNKYSVKVDCKLNSFTVNIEIFVDNYNVVYDKDDINAIIELNNKTIDNSVNEGTMITVGASNSDYETLEEAIENASAGDTIMGIDATVTSKINITKPLNITGFKFESGSQLTMKCELKDGESVTVENNSFTSDIPYDTDGTNHVPVVLDVKGTVKFISNDFNGDNVFYNAVETGQNNALATGSIFANNRFNGAIKNNAISIFKVDNGANVVIKNNFFASSNNTVRLSNINNVNAVFDIIQNKYYGTSDNMDHVGFLVLHADNEEDFGKYIINIKDLFYKSEKLTTNESGEKRIWYVDNSSTTPNVIIS